MIFIKICVLFYTVVKQFLVLYLLSTIKGVKLGLATFCGRCDIQKKKIQMPHLAYLRTIFHYRQILKLPNFDSTNSISVAN